MSTCKGMNSEHSMKSRGVENAPIIIFNVLEMSITLCMASMFIMCCMCMYVCTFGMWFFLVYATNLCQKNQFSPCMLHIKKSYIYCVIVNNSNPSELMVRTKSY